MQWPPTDPDFNSATMLARDSLPVTELRGQRGDRLPTGTTALQRRLKLGRMPDTCPTSQTAKTTDVATSLIIGIMQTGTARLPRLDRCPGTLR
jgi:hypothetical protein